MHMHAYAYNIHVQTYTCTHMRTYCITFARARFHQSWVPQRGRPELVHRWRAVGAPDRSGTGVRRGLPQRRVRALPRMPAVSTPPALRRRRAGRHGLTPSPG